MSQSTLTTEQLASQLQRIQAARPEGLPLVLSIPLNRIRLIRAAGHPARRDTCQTCGTNVGPGRAGRRCRKCRKDFAKS